MVRISNQELIELLMRNSRTPYVELASALGVSETAVRKRMKALERSGAIKRYTIDADPKKLGFGAQAVVGIDTLPERYIFVIESLRSMKEVVSLYSSSGDHMILAECWLADSGRLSGFIRKLESVEGVTRVCPAILNERIK